MKRYCWHCGAQLVPDSQFCAVCGKSLEPQVQDASPDTPDVSGQQTLAHAAPAAPVHPAKKKGSVLIVLVSLLLVLLGANNMALGTIGKSAVAKVTDATPSSQSDQGMTDPNRYNIKYEFFVDGERYSGNTVQTFHHGVASSQTIEVRYLPLWPGINGSVKDAKISGGLTLMGLGVGLFVLWSKGLLSFGRRR